MNRLFARVLLASLATVAIGVGCYNPKIRPGGLQCNKDYIEECPEGHYCLDGFCQKTGAPVVKTDGGGDRPADMKVDAAIDGAAPVDAVGEMMCYAPVPGCSPDAGGGKCDPTCQTGCSGCREKCSVNSTGALTCNPLSAGLVQPEGRGCEIYNDTKIYTDNCAPGLVCHKEACGEICVRFCRTNADCPNSVCSKSIGNGFRVCDTPTADCNPIKFAGATRCPGPSQGCYLSDTEKDRLVCDCSVSSLVEGAFCNSTRDCFNGLVCVDVTGAAADFRCRRVCSLTGVTNGGCPVGFTCRPWLESQKFGYCN